MGGARLGPKPECPVVINRRHPLFIQGEPEILWVPPKNGDALDSFGVVPDILGSGRWARGENDGAGYWTQDSDGVGRGWESTSSASQSLVNQGPLITDDLERGYTIVNVLENDQGTPTYDYMCGTASEAFGANTGFVTYFPVNSAVRLNHRGGFSSTSPNNTVDWSQNIVHVFVFVWDTSRIKFFQNCILAWDISYSRSLPNANDDPYSLGGVGSLRGCSVVHYMNAFLPFPITDQNAIAICRDPYGWSYPRPIYYGAAGGTTYQESISEGGKLGDTQANGLILPGTISEGVKAGDSPAARLILSGPISEGGKLGEILAGGLILPGTISEGVKAGDTQLGDAIYPAAITEGAKAGEVLVAGLLVSGTISEGGKLGDIQAFDHIVRGAITEGTKGGDTFAPILIAVGAITEGVKAGDTQAGLLTVQASISEGVKAGDAFVGGFVFANSISEGMKGGDTFAFDHIVRGTVSEGVKAGDTQAVLLTAQAAISEGVKAGDSFVAVMVVAASLSEGVKAGDAWVDSVIGATYQVSISEGVKAGDTPAANLLMQVAIGEGVKSGDTYLALVILGGSISEGAKAGDSWVDILAGLGGVIPEMINFKALRPMEGL